MSDHVGLVSNDFEISFVLREFLNGFEADGSFAVSGFDLCGVVGGEFEADLGGGGLGGRDSEGFAEAGERRAVGVDEFVLETFADLGGLGVGVGEAVEGF